MQIYKFNSILKPVLWGGDKLVRFKSLPAADVPIGESWELSALPGAETVVAEGGDRGLTLTQLVQRYGDDLLGKGQTERHGGMFPLLIKLIDAERDLSIQVHPNDEMAMREHGCKGKNEMWFVLQAQPGAKIRAGFKHKVTKDELDRRLADGSLLEILDERDTHPGDVFYITAGQIHSIGAGNLVVEIQQPSDITYRVWDYDRCDAQGNRRELHTALARQALDLTPGQGALRPQPLPWPGAASLVRTPHFAVDILAVAGEFAFSQAGWGAMSSCVAVVCIGGEGRLMAGGAPQATVGQGQTALIPAAMLKTVSIKGPCQLLLAYLPAINPLN